MKEVLAQYLGNFEGNRVTINGYDGYKVKDAYYFIIDASNNEEIHYEQKVISDFLETNGLRNIVSPILSMEGNLFTPRDEHNYIVLQGVPFKELNAQSHARTLATFHQTGARYPYEPKNISSYGKWKELWSNKIDAFGNIYSQQYNERPVTPFQRLFIDTFPYVTGLAENAIQYLQESENDRRYHEGDSGTITFQRYYNHMQEEIIWSPEMVYDHPARDIAEYLRPNLLISDDASFKRIRSFIEGYEQVAPLSVFSYRLIYARLLLPVHLFDFVERGLQKQDSESYYEEYKKMLNNQIYYEAGLKRLYDEIKIDANNLKIPLLDW